MNPETGRRFGPYEIQSRLGGGGMGYVFRAWDARLHREVAVKLLHNEYAMPGMRERFLREARAASALNHPNICTIFDIGEQDGDPYLVMELLEGETLRDRILNRTIQTDDIVCIGKEVAEALGAAHAKGIVHRDVKPANIFLVDRPNAAVQAKVLDFGLAKIEGGVLGARGGRAPDITTIGSTVGTLAYMSPEQARGETLDSRSDLFSLGVVLYEMATRHVPFQGATSALVFVKLLNHPPEPVRDWNEAIPRELEKIIFKLMAKERMARFQTAHEVVEALSHLHEKGSGGSWLRKAVATVPLVRVPDPTARERRTAPRKSTEAYPSSSRESAALSLAPTLSPPANDIPRPSSGGNQFLRPVARVPHGGDTPRPAFMPLAEQEPPAGSASNLLTPVSAAGQIDDQASLSPRSITAADALPLDRSGPAPTEVNRPSDGTTRRIIWTPLRICLLLVVLLALTAVILLLTNHGRFGTPLLTPDEAVVITEINNNTGDASLDGISAEGLQMALAQSPYLHLHPASSFLVAVHQRTLEGAERNGPAEAHDIAKRMGAFAYLIGSINNTTPPYKLHLELRNTGSNEIMKVLEENVSNLQQIPGAIDQLAVDLRAAVGENSDSIAKNANPLSREASAKIEALHAFSQGDALESSGNTADALAAFQRAVSSDPKFVQAQLRLVNLYSGLHAELAAADAARLALAAADRSGDRTRSFAQFEYEMAATGDYPRATSIIRHLLAASPRDPQTLADLARVLRLQGRMGEALQAAQQSYTEEPFNPSAYVQAEAALISLDRYDAAFGLEAQIAKLGLSHVGDDLTAAYLEGRQSAVDTAVASLQSSQTTNRTDWFYGIYLDNSGRLRAGADLWRSRAAAATSVKDLSSAGALLLSQGALDNALAGDCMTGLALARESDAQPQGLTALFNSGMAHALCGDALRATEIEQELHRTYPRSFAVTGFYLADLEAARALHASDPGAALEALRAARQYDLISLTPYLRGRAHVALRQVQIGIVDFQTVLAHRGVTFTVGNNVYPVAEIGVARAFADTGDLGNSAQAYRRFLQFWQNADTGEALLTESQAHTQ